MEGIKILMGFFLFVVIFANLNIPKGRNPLYNENKKMKELSRQEKKNKSENGQSNSFLGFLVTLLLLMLGIKAVFIGFPK